MLYSSGTTGRPKGVRPPMPKRRIDEPESREPLRAPSTASHRRPSTSPPAPLYHAAPLRFSTLVQELGGTVVVMERFDAEGALAAIQRYRATHSQWVPTMFVRMLKLPPEVRERYDVSSMRVAVHAAAPCPVDVKRAMIDWWGPVHPRVLRRHRGRRHHVHRLGAVAGTPGLGRPRGARRGADRRSRDAASCCPRAGWARSTSNATTAPLFTYHNDAEKTRASRHPEHDAGAPPATWATSTRTGGSTSPTARHS